MQLNHSYACFCLLKLLSPSVIIESGVWKGASTWLLQAILPNAQIFCLDPVLSNLQYQSSNAIYSTSDFLDYDWSSVSTLDSLCIFDDHQSALHRCLHMKWWGFKHALFEDNYPSGEGDFYSISQVIAGTGHTQIQLSVGEYRNLPLHSRLMRWLEQLVLEKLLLRRFYSAQSIVRRENHVDVIGFRHNVETCIQFPCLLRRTDLYAPYSSCDQPSLYSSYLTIKRTLDEYLSSHPELMTPESLYFNNITFLSLK